MFFFFSCVCVCVCVCDEYLPIVTVIGVAVVATEESRASMQTEWREGSGDGMTLCALVQPLEQQDTNNAVIMHLAANTTTLVVLSKCTINSPHLTSPPLE